MSKIIIGVATLPERRDFFRNVCFPSLEKQADEVHVFIDEKDTTLGWDYPEIQNISIADVFERKMGDIGKFIGYRSIFNVYEDFYYFTVDDDIEYPIDYIDRMKDWIDYYQRKAVCSVGGSNFNSMPIKSYYADKQTMHCLKNQGFNHPALLPMSGVSGFHSSLLKEIPLTLEEFETPNMSDIWFGIALQRRKIPVVSLNHLSGWLKYNQSLPIEETIWGQQNQKDFLQTAVVNEFSRREGFHLLDLPTPLEVKEPLGLGWEQSRQTSSES